MQNNGRGLIILNKTNILRCATNLPQYEIAISAVIDYPRYCVYP